MDKTAQYVKALLEMLRDQTPGEVLPVFKKLLAKRNEEYLLPGILKQTVELLEREGKTIVTSRYEMSPETKTQILGFLKKNFPEDTHDEAVFETDEKMLGGIKILHKDFLFDGTIGNKLNKI